MANQNVILEAHDIQSWEHVPKEGGYPEAIVGGFIRNKKGELLLVDSYKWKDLWSVPGGHVEFGETLVDALRREIMEEVGIKVKVTRLLDIQEAIYPKTFVRKAHFIFFNYLCEAVDSKLKLDKKEIQGYKWVKPEAAKKLKMNEFTRHTLKLLTLKGAYEASIPAALEKKLL
jgi:nucleoside triphosphatase